MEQVNKEKYYERLSNALDQIKGNTRGMVINIDPRIVGCTNADLVQFMKGNRCNGYNAANGGYTEKEILQGWADVKEKAKNIFGRPNAEWLVTSPLQILYIREKDIMVTPDGNSRLGAYLYALEQGYDLPKEIPALLTRCETYQQAFEIMLMLNDACLVGKKTTKLWSVDQKRAALASNKDPESQYVKLFNKVQSFNNVAPDYLNARFGASIVYSEKNTSNFQCDVECEYSQVAEWLMLNAFPHTIEPIEGDIDDKVIDRKKTLANNFNIPLVFADLARRLHIYLTTDVICQKGLRKEILDDKDMMKNIILEVADRLKAFFFYTPNTDNLDRIKTYKYRSRTEAQNTLFFITTELCKDILGRDCYRNMQPYSKLLRR